MTIGAKVYVHMLECACVYACVCVCVYVCVCDVIIKMAAKGHNVAGGDSKLGILQGSDDISAGERHF